MPSVATGSKPPVSTTRYGRSPSARAAVVPVARQPGKVGDERVARPREPVEQRRFADVRAADEDEGGQHGSSGRRFSRASADRLTRLRGTADSDASRGRRPEQRDRVGLPRPCSARRRLRTCVGGGRCRRSRRGRRRLPSSASSRCTIALDVDDARPSSPTICGPPGGAARACPASTADAPVALSSAWIAPLSSVT